MSTVRWVVQGNLGAQGDRRRLRQAILAQGLGYQEVDVVPFSDELPPVTATGPTLFYGATRFVTTVHQSHRWVPGVYFDRERFRFATVQRHYGAALLNVDAELTTLAELAAREVDPDRIVFVRPDHDLKEFPGQLISHADLRTWVARLGADDIALTPSTTVIVAEPAAIDAEYRLFVVDGAVITGSRYRKAGEVSIVADVPAAVERLAETLAASYSPAAVFVLDVALADGTPLVLETNCFHSSGFYAADLDAIVGAVSRRALQSWNDQVQARGAT
jgi:hypothetical protein